jgi:hypothetical protein
LEDEVEGGMQKETDVTAIAMVMADRGLEEQSGGLLAGAIVMVIVMVDTKNVECIILHCYMAGLCLIVTCVGEGILLAELGAGLVLMSGA